MNGKLGLSAAKLHVRPSDADLLSVAYRAACGHVIFYGSSHRSLALTSEGDMASLPQLQPDAAMAHAAVSSQPLQPQPTAALALSSALSAGALTPVQQASVPLQSGQLPLLVAAGGSAASGSGVGSDTGIPRTPASSNGVVDGTGSSAGTGAVGNSPRLASAGVPVASESDSRTLLAEYWFRVSSKVSRLPSSRMLRPSGISCAHTVAAALLSRAFGQCMAACFAFVTCTRCARTHGTHAGGQAAGPAGPGAL